MRYGLLTLALITILVPALAAPTAASAQSAEELLREQALETLEEAGVTDDVADRLAQPGPSAAALASKVSQVTAPITVATTGFRCVPSCDVDDGRLIAIAGDNLVTLSDPVLNVQFSVPAGTSSFTIGVFDGDSGDVDVLGNNHWDLGLVLAEFEYALFADPNADGTGMVPVLLGGLPTVSSLTMPTNDWADFAVNTSAAAESPSGNFFYQLQIKMLNPALTALNGFKLRTDGIVTIALSEQPFSYIANFNSFADLLLIYPDFPAITPTSYDGSFSFFFDVPKPVDDLTVWDGDFDRGKWDGTESDTDDPNTPGAPFLPPWATIDAMFEGVAAGSGIATGNPADDFNPAGNGIYFVRTPSIEYSLVSPEGDVYLNANPSGNQEWEAFTLSTAPFDASQMDHSVASIPAGIWEMAIGGVDLQNLNAVYLPGSLLCINPDGSACVPLRPFLVGDTVFFDLNGNGIQDPGEPGVPGVVLELRDEDGDLVTTTTTDTDGLYSFGVFAGEFTVTVAASNFASGGALESTVSTTGNAFTNTVVDDNILTYDFGYRGTGSLGDFVWFDADANGLQNEGVTGGLGGVTVILTGAGGDGLFGTADDFTLPSQVTAADGSYLFTNLPQNLYRVDVVEATLPAGLSLTTGNEPLTVALGAGETFLAADFGYVGTGSLGDRLWLDLNANGVQDVGEPGFEGVTVLLSADLDGDGVFEVQKSVATGANGLYSFTGLPAGTYKVTVVAATLPAGVIPTFDLDGVGTPNVATVVLAAGQNRLDVDYGYRGTAKIGDRVWRDDDSDGIQDAGEPGINGVLVTLRSADGTIVLTRVTSGNGNYLFENLPPGTYTVTVTSATVPAGLEPTFAPNGLAMPYRGTTTVVVNQADLTLDFGYDQCGPCQGKVSRLTFLYTGTSPRLVEVIARRGKQKSAPAFGAVVSPGDTFFVDAPPNAPNKAFTGTLGTEIRIFVDGTFHVMIHTSCSVPIGPGQIFGDFVVIAGASKGGGPLCPLAPLPDLTGSTPLLPTGGDGSDGGLGGDSGITGSTPTATVGVADTKYWLENPRRWPLTEMSIAGHDLKQDTLLWLLYQSDDYNASLVLAKELVTAELNITAGARSDCAFAALLGANEWIAIHGIRVSVKDSQWLLGGGELLYKTLKEYNKGKLCAPAR